jgi:hypothetical protein
VGWNDTPLGVPSAERTAWYRQEEERLEREAKAAAAAAAAKLRVEEDACFALICSDVDRDRLEGYRRHLALLAQRHKITIRDGSPARALWSTRTCYAPYPPGDEEEAAVVYHEVGHLLAGRCPDDGTVHRRDQLAAVFDSTWNCIACETAATSRALSLAPFTKPMFDRLASGLRSYRRCTPAAAREIQKLDQLAGTINFRQHQLRWMAWFEKKELVARWTRESQQEGHDDRTRKGGTVSEAQRGDTRDGRSNEQAPRAAGTMREASACAGYERCACGRRVAPGLPRVCRRCQARS